MNGTLCLSKSTTTDFNRWLVAHKPNDLEVVAHECASSRSGYVWVVDSTLDYQHVSR